MIPISMASQHCATCPCGGESCTFFTDDFGDGTITGWTQTGSWTETGGILKMASGSNGIIICDTAHPDAASTMVAEVKVKLASGDNAGLIVAASDSSNHYIARIFQSSSFAAIYSVVGGTDTEIASVSGITWSTATWYTIKLCIDYQGNLTFYKDGASILSAFGESPTGTKGGLRASDSSVEFDDFSIGRTSPDEENTIGCDECNNYVYQSCDDVCDSIPDEITVDLGAFGLEDVRCDYCDQVLGEYTLTRNPSDSCNWVYILNDVCVCTGSAISRPLKIGAVLLSGGSGVCDWEFAVDVGTQGDGSPPSLCRQLVRYALTGLTPDQAASSPINLSLTSASGDSANNSCNAIGRVPSTVPLYW